VQPLVAAVATSTWMCPEMCPERDSNSRQGHPGQSVESASVQVRGLARNRCKAAVMLRPGQSASVCDHVVSGRGPDSWSIGIGVLALTEWAPMERPFNSTFFATVAVVIPVIFLAVALQSDYLARTFVASRRFHRVSRDQLRDTRNRRSKRSVLSFGTWYFSWLLGIAGFGVIGFGVQGEILSLVALEQQQATLSTQSDVMQSAVVLVVVATIASVWRVVDAFIKAEKESQKRDSTPRE